MKSVKISTVLLCIVILWTIWSTTAIAASEVTKLVASDYGEGDRFGIEVGICGDVAVVGSHFAEVNDMNTGAAYIFRFDGSNWSEEAKLIASDGNDYDRFGCAVEVSGSAAIIGAQFGDDLGTADTGAAYIFRFSGSSWVEEAKLTALDSGYDDRFGYCVDISGNKAIVGAYYDDDNGHNSGSAYIFRYNGSNWVQEAKLTAPDGDANDGFGVSVGIWGDTAVIGAFRDDEGSSDSGSAYVFKYDGLIWTEDVKLTASDGTADDLFGSRASIDGDTIIIGASDDDPNGSAYIFRYEDANWVEEAKLVASDGALGDYFGYSVDISEDIAIVGARYGDANGSAYIFEYNDSNWSEAAKLLASDGESDDEFGFFVGISGDIAVIGAPGDNVNDVNCGSAYIFDVYDSNVSKFGCELSKEIPLDGAGDDAFGGSVSIFGDTAVIGAEYDDDNGNNSGSAYIYGLNGSSWGEETKLTASDGLAGDSFGCSVGLFGDTAVIGARHDNDKGSDSGSAYIFRFDGSSWVEEKKLFALDGAAGDSFGSSVSIWGDTAIIGACYDDADSNDSGSAYIFRYNGSNWVQEAKLSDANSPAGAYFGYSVEIFGDTAIVGASGDNDCGSASGSAYIFRYNGSSWIEEKKLLAADGASGDNFGRTVSIFGNTAIVGANGNDDKGSNSGSAYIFRFNDSSWVQEAKLLASDSAAGDAFGYSVDITSNTAIIGAPNNDGNDSDSGSVYIFRYDGSNWVEERKLIASDGSPDDWLGGSVSIWGDTTIVGAEGNDDNGSYSGSIYIFGFEGSTWEEKLRASDAAIHDRFGQSVGISVDTAVIGAYWNDDNGYDSGSAYIFRFDGSEWLEEAKLLASDGAALDEFGSSVGIWGNTAVIGAPFDNVNDINCGSAYIFRFDGTNWDQEAKLLASDGAEFDLFGTSVDISGDTAIIGAVYDDIERGSAYIFRFNGSSWVQEAKLVASDGAGESDHFGVSVSISGDTAIIGADHDDEILTQTGSAYIFRFNGSSWVEEAKLLASDSESFDYFGYSVGISGDTTIIGAYGEGDYSNEPGSAYIFRYDGSSWVEEAKLLASDGADNDRFGYSVGISGDKTVIGAYRSPNGTNIGSAYIFGFNGSSWVEERKLLASDGAEEDRFGWSVDISGNTALVGAYRDEDVAYESGSAYIFGLSLNPGDLDHDNHVDMVDYSLFALCWLEDDCGLCGCDGDFTGDGAVDIYDLKELCDNWLAGK